jgi:hypothetical protein
MCPNQAAQDVRVQLGVGEFATEQILAVEQAGEGEQQGRAARVAQNEAFAQQPLHRLRFGRAFAEKSLGDRPLLAWVQRREFRRVGQSSPAEPLAALLPVHRAAGNQHDASGVVQLLGAVSEPILLRFGQLVQRVDDQQEASLLKGVLEPFCGCVGQVFGDGAREVAFFCQQACGEPEGYLNGIEGGAVLELLHCLLGERQHEVACAKCFAAAGRADERGALLVLHTPYKLLPAYLLLLGILAGQFVERSL